ncbi:MAG: aldose epimerase family protein [Marinifilaceae bacterium]
MSSFNCNKISHLTVKRDAFQGEVDGKKVDLYALCNANGVEIAVTNYGAFVVSVMVPDKDGNFADVVLGHNSLEEYINTPEPYLGSVVGRYANRIANGCFTLDGVEYNLAINNGPNSLHGGKTGFNKKVWDVLSADCEHITMQYVSPDGEENYPGTLTVTMTYRLTADNALVIDYVATTDKKTVVNLTNHAFFNLDGQKNPAKTITHDVLTINADFYTPMDAVSIPTGEIAKVEGTPMDFRTPHTIGERIDADFEQLVFGKGYDHNYVLNKKEVGELSFAAKVLDPDNGRTLEVFTTEPGVQLYTGNWLGGFAGKEGATYPERSAFCLEVQHFPDSPNKPHFPSVVLAPGEEYTQQCVYKFGVEK